MSRASDILDVLGKVRTRGHWRVIIRPTPFSERRIQDFEALLPTLERARVSLRGWDFPHVSPQDVSADITFIQQATDWAHHVEAWRFFQSGQFVLYAGFPDDWRNQSDLWPPDTEWQPGERLGIGATIFRFTEAFEFAARLAETAAGGDTMEVRIDTVGIRGRQFYVDDPRRLDSGHDRRPEMESFPYKKAFSRAELLASPRDHAIRACDELFQRCHTGIPGGVLRDWQRQLGRN